MLFTAAEGAVVLVVQLGVLSEVPQTNGEWNEVVLTT